MRALVTGADGFAGQWLLDALLAAGDEVAGASRAARPSLTTLDGAQAARVLWLCIDLADADSVREAIAQSRPEVVYHLAAQSSVPESERNPVATYETNVVGTARMLEACQAIVPGATIVVIGSADAYGAVEPGEMPLRENAPLRPTNPYAASKAAAESIALYYARAGRVRVICTRSFNHTGPGQSPTFAASAFAKRIAEIKHAKREPVLRVGSLEPRRDMSDVRDVVLAYRLLAQRGVSGSTYNVCSGQAVSMREVVEELVRIADVDLEIAQDETLVRPVDTPLLVGDCSELRRVTGWTTTIPLRCTLADLYAWHLGAE